MLAFIYKFIFKFRSEKAKVGNFEYSCINILLDNRPLKKSKLCNS